MNTTFTRSLATAMVALAAALPALAAWGNGHYLQHYAVADEIAVVSFGADLLSDDASVLPQYGEIRRLGRSVERSSYWLRLRSVHRSSGPPLYENPAPSDSGATAFVAAHGPFRLSFERPVTPPLREARIGATPPALGVGALLWVGVFGLAVVMRRSADARDARAERNQARAERDRESRARAEADARLDVATDRLSGALRDLDQAQMAAARLRWDAAEARRQAAILSADHDLTLHRLAQTARDGDAAEERARAQTEFAAHIRQEAAVARAAAAEETAFALAAARNARAKAAQAAETAAAVETAARRDARAASDAQTRAETAAARARTDAEEVRAQAARVADAARADASQAQALAEAVVASAHADAAEVKANAQADVERERAQAARAQAEALAVAENERAAAAEARAQAAEETARTRADRSALDALLDEAEARAQDAAQRAQQETEQADAARIQAHALEAEGETLRQQIAQANSDRDAALASAERAARQGDAGATVLIQLSNPSITFAPGTLDAVATLGERSKASVLRTLGIVQHTPENLNVRKNTVDLGNGGIVLEVRYTGHGSDDGRLYFTGGGTRWTLECVGTKNSQAKDIAALKRGLSHAP